MNGFKGICMSGGKFPKPWQVTDNIIEWFFSQFKFNILQETQTQKIITCRVSKIHEWFRGDLYEWGESFSSHDKWQIKLLKWIFSQFTFKLWPHSKYVKFNHKIRVQECYGGGATSHQWHHMTSCDVISMIGGGVCHRGGVCHGEFKVDNFHMIFLQILHKPAWNSVKILCKYSYLFFSQFEAWQSDKIQEIRQ